MTDERPAPGHRAGPADAADAAGGADSEEVAGPADRVVKQLEWWQLLRSAVPLIAAGIGVSWLYATIATQPDLGIYWLGPALGVPGALCALVGYLGRLREIRSTRPTNARHYPWLFIGWVLVVAGLLIPPYSGS